VRLNYIDCCDCLEGLKDIPDNSVDCIITDPPYGVTRNAWDKVLHFDKLWAEYKRIIKDRGAILIFADGQFMARLMLSEPRLWRYNLVWNKVLVSGFLNANKMPLRQTEEVCVFYKKAPKYNPQKTLGAKSHSKGRAVGKSTASDSLTNNNYGAHMVQDNAEKLGNLKHPTSLLTFPKPHPSTTVHPTQKPVELIEYLIKTYSDPGDVVLDTFMGSGTTAVACLRTGRNYIGFELSAEYCKIAEQRIADTVDALLEVST
jgi:DNA modification methylase